LLSAAVAGLIAVVAGFPYWEAHVASGGVAFAMSATLAAAGSLLSMGAGSHKSGALLLSASMFGAFSWLSSWDSGLLPAVGEMTQSLFFLCLSIGILLAGRPGLDAWFEQVWVVFAIAVLPVQELFILLSASSADLGYSANARWPSLRLSGAAVQLEFRIATVLYAILALTLIAILIAQGRRLPVPQRGRNLLLILCTGTAALGSAAFQAVILAPKTTLEQEMNLRSGQMGAAIIIPLALFASAYAGKWEEISVASRIHDLLTVVTPNSVEQVLRSILRDPGLRIWLWVPAKGCYVDADGRIRPSGATADEGRALHEVRTADGETLAVCDVSGLLVAQQRMLRSAMQASTPALLAARLQVEKLEQLRALQVRVLEVELATRSELARNIHDGVQQDLAALHIDMGRLRRRCPTEDLRELADECGARIAEITSEVRRIARGLHPQALQQRGLAGALEEDAERLGRRVTLDIASGRLPPQIELALYYMLSEALTNAQKHANARNVSVSVRIAGDRVVAEVADDGAGGAALTFGGGLHGIDDRVRAMGGTLEIHSGRGHGTRISIGMPLPAGIP
jgi:signal transduction histidine kinase